MPRLAYYITSHGYGHLVRSLEILKDFKGWDVFLISDFEKLDLDKFQGEITYNIRHEILDVGVIQENALDLNLDKTLSLNLDLIKRESSIIEKEIEFLRSEKIDIILADIPPLIFKIAKILSIPAYAVGNFSWDWIYEGFVSENSGFKELSIKYHEYYNLADGIFELPFSSGLSAFKRSYKTGLVRRKPIFSSKEKVRDFLNISHKKKVVLVSFGGIGFVPPLEKIEDVLFLFPGETDRRINDNYMEVHMKKISHPDLLLASDFVLTKPGYGIISEIWGHDIFFIYTDRGPFREYDVLVKYVKKFIPKNLYIPSSEVKSGEWIEKFKLLLK